MARIHLSHRDISEDFLSEIRTMTAERPWTLDAAGRSAVVKNFFDSVCSQAEIAVPEVEFFRSRTIRRAAPGYEYTPAITGSLGLSVTPAVVKFPRWRTVEIVTAIRKHIDFLNGDRFSDPIAWGASAVYLASPVAFRDAARKGKVRNVTAQDTYTTVSWQKLVEADLVDRRGNLRFPSSDISYFLQHGQLPPASLVEVVPSAPLPDVRPIVTDEDLEGHDVPDDLEEVVAAAVTAAVTRQDEQDDEEREALDALEVTGTDEGAVYQEATEGPFEGTLVAPNEITDGLDALGIVALRKVSRGVVSGGYSMTKPVLVHAIRQNLSAEVIAAKIASL